MTVLNPGAERGRDWGWIVFLAICIGGMAVVIAIAVYFVGGSPGYETRQERFDRIEREIGQLEARVAELESKR